MMNRRDFVKYGVGSLLATPLVVHGIARPYTDSYASSIVSVLDQHASRVDYREGKVMNSDGVLVDKILSFDLIDMRVARMVDAAVMKFTNQTTVGKAWESLFPDGQLDIHTKIGVKLNFSYGEKRNDRLNDWSKNYCPFGPKSAVSNAIVTGLAQMLDGTFPVENITLFERRYSLGNKRYFPIVQGYRPVLANDAGVFKNTRSGSCGIHWIDQSNRLELPSNAPGFEAAPDYSGHYRAPQRIYSEVYSNDFLINYIIAKDHREAGITGAMKNTYGCTDNPMATHGLIWTDKNSPYAGSRICAPEFYKNINRQAPFILNILDALAGVYHGGPLSGKVFQANTIAVSKDPVALDTYMLHMINQARKKRGFTAIGTSDGWTPEGHPNASFLKIASENHEMGSMSLDNLQSYDLSSNPVQTELPVLQKSQSRISEVRRKNENYQVQLFLDPSGNKHSIESSIEDIYGKVIRNLKSQSTVSSEAVIQWDRRDNNNKQVEDGIYAWFIVVDGVLHSCTINDHIYT